MNYVKATKEDFETLFKLRISAMQPSLEKVGRFNIQRSRDRFNNSFIPEFTTIIKDENQILGFYMITENDDHIFLNHLYIDPKFQSRKIGSKLLNRIKKLANSKNIKLEALKESPSNEFYKNNGFTLIGTSDFDNKYIWVNKCSKKLNNNLYITDLDSTLLNNEAELSQFTQNGIQTLIDINIKLTVASARSVKSIQTIFKDIDLKLPIIEFNGAFITDLKSGEHIVINSIKKKIYNKLLKEFIDQKFNCIISTFNGTEDKLYYEKTSNDGDRHYIKTRTESKDPRLEKVEDITKIKDDDIICITIIDRPENLEKELERLKNIKEIEVHLQENIYSPGWYWLTIHDKKASKDQAIKELQKLTNLDDYKLITFGDNTNDIKMLKSADIGIAVENGLDEIKEISDKIIESNINDGVIKYILDVEGHI